MKQNILVVKKTESKDFRNRGERNCSILISKSILVNRNNDEQNGSHLNREKRIVRDQYNYRDVTTVQ